MCDTHNFILGPEVEKLEAELAQDLGARHAIGVSSGTDALIVSLMALDIGPGDEVIIPTLSFFATAGAVARLGATPVFVDVDPVNLMIDPAAVRRALTSRTRAVMPVHLFGLCAEMDALLEIGSEHNIRIVEDAAQALGAAYKGRPAGLFGDVGCFSFFPTKNLGAFGDAGLVVTNDDALGRRIRLLRNHGASPKYYHREIGGNFRLDALQAAVLRVKRPHLGDWNSQRRQNAARYREGFTRAGLAGRVTLPEEPAGQSHVYHQYVIRVPERDRVRTFLTDRGIGTEVYYPVPFHRQECFTHYPSSLGQFPNADAAVAEVLALPVYPGLSDEQASYVISSIGEALG